MPFSAISLLDYLNVQPGQWIVQNTANGMVGRMLAQLASARGSTSRAWSDGPPPSTSSRPSA